MSERDAEVVAALIKVARPVILSMFDARSCIASTRIGIDALDYFGVQAVPVPLSIVVFNTEALEMLHAGKDLPEIQAEALKYDATDQGGPWTMGVGAEIENSNGWAGHLVVGLPQMRLLLDLAFDQVSRPLKGLTFTEPQLFPVVDTDWWLKEKRYVELEGTSEGREILLILDNEAPDPEGYKRSPNWRRASSKYGSRRVFQELTGQIIRLMKDELQTSQLEDQ